MSNNKITPELLAFVDTHFSGAVAEIAFVVNYNSDEGEIVGEEHDESICQAFDSLVSELKKSFDHESAYHLASAIMHRVYYRAEYFAGTVRGNA